MRKILAILALVMPLTLTSLTGCEMFQEDEQALEE